MIVGCSEVDETGADRGTLFLYSARTGDAGANRPTLHNFCIAFEINRPPPPPQYDQRSTTHGDCPNSAHNHDSPWSDAI